MKSGDLVQCVGNTYFYYTTKQIKRVLHDGIILKGDIGLVIDPPDGIWLKWLVNGKVCLSNAALVTVEYSV